MSQSGALSVEDLVAGYSPEVDILNAVSVRLAEREIVAVVGPNGAGKSTLLKAIVGLVKPKRGRVWLADRSLDGLKPSAVARLGVGYVPQRDNVFPSLTVAENLEMGLAAALEKPLASRLEAMYSLFPRLAERRRQKVATMSGGERQMVAMARALVPEPSVLLLDEPMAGVNRALGGRLLDKVDQLRREEGTTFLFIEHNMDVVMTRADRVVVMAEGAVIADGPPSSIQRDPRVLDAYLGRRAIAV